MSITPGKWKVTEGAFGGAKFDHQIGICSVDGKLIATASTIHVGAINAEANARAIAEVPAMIEALNDAVRAMTHAVPAGRYATALRLNVKHKIVAILKRIEG